MSKDKQSTLLGNIWQFDYNLFNNCTSDTINTVDEYPSDIELTFDLKTDKGYIFDGDPIIFVENKRTYDRVFEIPLKVDVSKTSATVTFIPNGLIFDNNVNEIYCSATVISKPVVTGVYFSLYHALGIQNQTITIDGVKEPISEEKSYPLYTPCIIELVANDGAEFEQIPYISYFDQEFIVKKVDFTVNESKTIATLEWTINALESDVNRVEIHSDTETIPTGDLLYFDTVNIYRPTKAELKELLLSRYSSDPNKKGDIVDITSYFVSLRYTNIPITDIGQKSTIKLGDFKSFETKADTISNIEVVTDLGSIHVDGVTGTINDYTKSTYKIYLPYYGYHEIDSVYTVNSDLQIIYKTNLLEGLANIEI